MDIFQGEKVVTETGLTFEGFTVTWRPLVDGVISVSTKTTDGVKEIIPRCDKDLKQWCKMIMVNCQPYREDRTKKLEEVQRQFASLNNAMEDLFPKGMEVIVLDHKERRALNGKIGYHSLEDPAFIWVGVEGVFVKVHYTNIKWKD